MAYEFLLSTLRSQTLARAAVILGGVAQLAEELHIRKSVVASFIGGRLPVPPEAFLRAIEIVTEQSLKDAGAKYLKPDQKPRI